MKKDFFYVLLILVLVKIAASPIPELQNQTEKKEPAPTLTDTTNKPTEKAECNLQDQQSSDELSSLLSNKTQNSKSDHCLFLGCNGFF